MWTSDKPGAAREPQIWEPTPVTNFQFRGLRVMHGGPIAMYLPEHEHRETQVQTRFRRAGHSGGLFPLASSLYAPGQPHRGGIEDNWEVVVVLLDPLVLAKAADELFSRDRFEIRPFSSVRSPMLEQLCRAMRAELFSPHGASRTYLESLGHVITGHILRHHANTAAGHAIRGTFSATQLDQINRFIDERAGTDLSIDDLATLMKLGPQRFTARFLFTTQMSPWQYVQERRLIRARELLRHSRIRLADIALSLGFSSQSHFTSAFRRAVGVTPRIYRNSL